ncbi:arabinose operon regulatory protein [Pseudomonas sp. SCT]|uniref:DNA-binding domain-containing protein, AraC-type n=1 Tax=Stutzerimonas stutzeri RCH2 TaxID=644801 RepID=L0GMX8_STUST|nr:MULTISPECIES: DNA-binding response regulator [Pseudomonadaceae]AGA87147.1 DNA-binding domain-containing protein, AraC-type [Stutzerimonas stutzeri RCH2]GCA55967.1 arabinose operon regulatory protein [Pseudomonas sp. SCT]
MMSNSATGPSLLWLDMTCERSTQALMAQFSDFCDCRLIAPDSLVADSGLHLRQADMICMHFDRPDALGLSQLQQLKRSVPSLPITMFTVQHTEELAVWAMRSRVWEYITLPISSAEMARYRRALLELHALRRIGAGYPRQPMSEVFPELPACVRLTADHRKHQSLARALQHIDQHFRENIDQKELAQLCGMTPSRFSRLFKDVYGICYLEHILARRMEFAKDRLDNSQMPITTIGYEAGFRDPSYFARVFKQFAGCTPSEYRNRLVGATSVSDLSESFAPLAEIEYDIGA